VSALTLQSEVTGEIVSQLAVAVAPAAPKPVAPTANPEAYDLYLRARLLQDDDEPEKAEALLNQALTLDPSFGTAYAARAQSQHSMIFDNYDVTEQRLTLERKDVDAARRLLGSAAPLVLALEAQYLDLAAPDHADAIHRMEAAEAAGLVDSTAARQKAMLLMLDDRLDESIATLQSLAVRDPANILVLMNLAAELGLAQRPVEALRIRNVTMERYPGMVFPLLQGRLIFAFTGKTDAWRSAADLHRDALRKSRCRTTPPSSDGRAQHALSNSSESCRTRRARPRSARVPESRIPDGGHAGGSARPGTTRASC
jgi:tetratricopeptide (TPR) repeat protein